MESDAEKAVQELNSVIQRSVRRREDSIAIIDESNIQIRLTCDMSDQEETFEKIDHAFETMRYLKYKFSGHGKP